MIGNGLLLKPFFQPFRYHPEKLHIYLRSFVGNNSPVIPFLTLFNDPGKGNQDSNKRHIIILPKYFYQSLLFYLDFENKLVTSNATPN